MPEIVDAHVHLWDPHTPRRAALLTELALKLPGSRAARAVIRPAAAAAATLFPLHWEPARPRYLPADYARDCAAVPIRGLVAVGSGWHDRLPGLPGALHARLRQWGGATVLPPLAETRWLLRSARNSAIPVSAVLVRANIAGAGLAAELDAQQALSPLVRGVTVAAARHPDPGIPSFTHSYRLLAQAAFLDGFAQIAARGMTCDVWVYSHDLPDVAELARRYPEVTIVVDHLGTPAGVLGTAGRGTGLTQAERRGLLRSWSDDLAAVAQLPNTVVKVSGLALPMLGHEVPLPGHTTAATKLADRAGHLLTEVLDIFGPDRTMWGSNMPVDRAVADIGALVSAVREVVAAWGADALPAVFGGTARRVYGDMPGNVGSHSSENK